MTFSAGFLADLLGRQVQSADSEEPSNAAGSKIDIASGLA